MSEENQTIEPQPTENAGETEPVISGADVRNHPLFQELAKQVRESREALTAREQAEQQAKAEAEQKELEAKGEYTTLLAQKEAEYSSKIESYESKLLKMELKSTLIQADMKDPLVLAGAISGFSGSAEDIGAYVEQLKADSPHHFAVNVEMGGKPGTGHGSPASRSSSKSLEERLAEGDVDAQRQKWNELMGGGA